jgi:hypothetical protein
LRLPPHDPNRTFTTDIGHGGVTNAVREEFGRQALLGHPDSNEPEDVIPDILHHVHRLGGDPLAVLEAARNHFLAEAGPLNRDHG